MAVTTMAVARLGLYHALPRESLSFSPILLYCSSGSAGSALENAASIAGMFLTTECVIVEKKEDKPEMPMGAPGMGGMGGMM